MTKKDKMSIDELDFDDISEKDLTKASESSTSTRSSIKKKKKPNRKTKQIEETLLSIPLSDDPIKFVSKTISECSGKEFVNWSNSVAYPLKPDYSFYDIEKNRISAFMRITLFHKKRFAISNPKSTETIH